MLMEHLVRLFVFVLPIDKIWRAVNYRKNFGVSVHIDFNAAEEFFFLYRALPPDFQQLPHAPWRVKIAIAQDDEDAVTGGKLLCKPRYRIAHPDNVFVPEDHATAPFRLRA